MAREVYGRPVTRATEPLPHWRQVWPLRIAGLIGLALLIYLIVLLLVHIRIAGG
ncbi:MAG TPA: hypothetical protein VF288_11525 [Mycobacteriales bacterium]